MKVLVDENIDQQFPEFIRNHDVFHVVELGWQGIQNGQLLRKAEESGFQVLITADKNMPYQQNLRGRTLSLIVLDIHPNILNNQVGCIPAIEHHLVGLRPGEIFKIDGNHSRKRPVTDTENLS